MSAELFQDRKRALEEAFFARQNKMLIEKLRHKAETEQQRQDLARAAGISDVAVLDKLLELEMAGDTVAALTLVPLVEVAWADGSISGKEREAILQAARDQGLESGSPERELLESWLDERPEAELLVAWKGYVKALTEALGPEERRSLEQDVLGRARAVAEAAGGFLGLGNPVSDAEQRMLEELAGAFSD